MESQEIAIGDPAELAGGLLGSLARGWLAGPVQVDALLADLAGELQAEVVEWLPDGPGLGVAWPHHRPRSVDWVLAGRVAPAGVHLVGAEDRRRSPRLASGAGREFYVRTGPGASSQGILRIVCGGVLPIGRVALVALAELVAGIARVSAQAEEAETADRERRLGQRAASLTHDLRNQLTLALLQVERLREAEAGSEDFGELYDVLATARELCVAGLEGEVSAPAQPTVLRELLAEEAAAAMAVSRGAASVRVKARCPAGLSAHSDGGLVRRLVRNLVANACEASPGGAVVRVEAVALPRGRTGIVVEDVGRGMDRGGVEGLLALRRAPGYGTGYGGVSLVECLVELGAECIVESAPGAGTRVEVRLPGPLHGLRPALLVLDPDSDRRRRRCDRAIAAGRAVIGAADPAEALRALRSAPVADVIVARGASGAGLEDLLDRVRRAGASIEQLPSGS